MASLFDQFQDYDEKLSEEDLKKRLDDLDDLAKTWPLTAGIIRSFYTGDDIHFYMKREDPQ